MMRSGKRIPWVLVGVCGIAGVFILGCGGSGCGDYLIELLVSSAEPLLLDDSELDMVTRPPTLIAGIEPSDPDYSPVVTPLVRSTDTSFLLDEPFTLVGMWPDSDVDVVPSDFVLSFELEPRDESDTGYDGFPPITQQGGAEEVELWNGWTLALEWGEPDDWCK
jgi:hypothetical protein